MEKGNFDLGHPVNSDGSNHVRSSMFHRSKPRIGCSSSITNI